MPFPKKRQRGRPKGSLSRKNFYNKEQQYDPDFFPGVDVLIKPKPIPKVNIKHLDEMIEYITNNLNITKGDAQDITLNFFQILRDELLEGKSYTLPNVAELCFLNRTPKKRYTYFCKVQLKKDKWQKQMSQT